MRARKPGDEAGSWRADRWWWRAELHGARRVIAREQPGGRWRYPGGNPQIHSRAAYDQLQTYRQVAVLVCKYGLDRQHPAFPAAAVFLASFWTEAGDYRGIYGRQCTPNYSVAITELLLRAGYVGSAQVENTMRWLLAASSERRSRSRAAVKMSISPATAAIAWSRSLRTPIVSASPIASLQPA